MSCLLSNGVDVRPFAFASSLAQARLHHTTGRLQIVVANEKISEARESLIAGPGTVDDVLDLASSGTETIADIDSDIPSDAHNQLKTG